MKRRAALLRRLYLKVHPDLFEVHPAAQRVNDASFKTLQGLLNCSSSSSVLHFFVEETSSADDSPPTLRSVQAQVRAGAAFDGDVQRLVEACYNGGDVDGPVTTAASDSAGVAGGSGGGPQFTQRPWWRERGMRQGRRRPPLACGSLAALLARHADEARSRSAEAARAHTELIAGLSTLRDRFGVHVRFEHTLRCVLTKRRLLMTLHEQLTAHEDFRDALGARSVYFTMAEPSAAAMAMVSTNTHHRDGSDHAGDRVPTRSETSLSAPPSGAIWLSSSDTPTGWQHAVRQERKAATAGQLGPTPASGPAALAQRRSTTDADHDADKHMAALAGIQAAETDAAQALRVRSIVAELRGLRASAAYLHFLEGLSSAMVREGLERGGRWYSAMGTAAGWRALVQPPSTLAALRQPSLQPRMLRLRLPLGGDLNAVVPFLESDGASTVLETAKARRLIGDATSALRLRGLRADEGVQPRQVVAAAEALLAHEAELRALGCEGCVFVIGTSGFSMSSDGSLKLPWNAAALS